LQEAFEAFHRDETFVKKFLKPLHIGSVSDYVDDDMNRDFRELKKTAIKMVSAES